MKKLALIGCGGIGEYHFSHFVKYDFVEVVGFCDLIKERAEALAEKYKSGNVYTDYKEMYDVEKPDMVFICVPPTCHGEIEYETINRGIHFFVEKPMALDMELAKDICEKAEAKNLITAVGFQCRYDNINIKTREFVEKNEIATINASRVGGIPNVPWWMTREESGGQLVEQAIHQLDILIYLFGEIDTVYSVRRKNFVNPPEHPTYDNDDMSLSIFTFKNGISCSFMCGCYSLKGHSWDSKITLGGKQSRLDYELTSKVTIYGEQDEEEVDDLREVIKGDGTQKNIEGAKTIVVKNDMDFGLLCDETFIKAVINNDPSQIRSSYRVALPTLAAALAANKSMETGLPQKV